MRQISVLIFLLAATLACAITKDDDVTPLTPTPSLGLEEYGFVEVEGFSAINQGGNYVLPVGETVTFTWQEMNLADLVQAEFSYRPYDGGALLAVGIDDDLSDGAQVTWTVPEGIAGTITASARLPGQTGEGVESVGVGVNSDDNPGAIRDQ